MMKLCCAGAIALCAFTVDVRAATFTVDLEFEITRLGIFGFSFEPTTSPVADALQNQPGGPPSCFVDPATATTPETLFCGGGFHDVLNLSRLGLFDLATTGWTETLSASFVVEQGESQGLNNGSTPLENSCVGDAPLCGVVNDFWRWSFNGQDLFAVNLPGSDSQTILNTATGSYEHVGYITDYGGPGGPGSSTFSFLDVGESGIADIGFGGFSASYALVSKSVMPVVPLAPSGVLLGTGVAVLGLRRRRSTVRQNAQGPCANPATAVGNGRITLWPRYQPPVP